MNDTIHLEKVSMKTKIMRAFWNIACCIFFRPFPTKIFWPWRRMLLRCFGAKVDSHSHVYSSARIWAPWNLNMAAGSCLGPAVICYNQAMVTLGQNAIVSQYAYICTAGHETSQDNNADTGLIVAPVTLRSGSWIGTRAFIAMGVEIGENAIVGATASVYKDVEANTIVGGNPAKIIRRR